LTTRSRSPTSSHRWLSPSSSGRWARETPDRGLDTRICPGPLIARASFGRGQHLHRQTLWLRSVAGLAAAPCRVSVPLRKGLRVPLRTPASGRRNPPGAQCGMGAQAPNSCQGRSLRCPLAPARLTIRLTIRPVRFRPRNRKAPFQGFPLWYWARSSLQTGGFLVAVGNRLGNATSVPDSLILRASDGI
jgi:hypothetical protein